MLGRDQRYRDERAVFELRLELRSQVEREVHDLAGADFEAGAHLECMGKEQCHLVEKWVLAPKTGAHGAVQLAVEERPFAQVLKVEGERNQMAVVVAAHAKLLRNSVERIEGEIQNIGIGLNAVVLFERGGCSPTARCKGVLARPYRASSCHAFHRAHDGPDRAGNRGVGPIRTG